jgi:uncharacterized membrane protein
MVKDPFELRVQGYLDALENGLAGVPRSERKTLVGDVESHIEAALAEIANPTEADVLNILDRLGTPAEVAAEERRRLGIADAQSQDGNQSVLDILAIVLLVIFWPVGVVLLWVSPSWCTRDKVIGTTALPVAFVAFVVLFVGMNIFVPLQVCGSGAPCNPSSPPEIVEIFISIIPVAFFLFPLGTAIYLAIQLSRSRRME